MKQQLYVVDRKRALVGKMDLLLVVFNPCTGTVVRLIADE